MQIDRMNGWQVAFREVLERVYIENRRRLCARRRAEKKRERIYARHARGRCQ